MASLTTHFTSPSCDDSMHQSPKHHHLVEEDDTSSWLQNTTNRVHQTTPGDCQQPMRSLASYVFFSKMICIAQFFPCPKSLSEKFLSYCVSLTWPKFLEKPQRSSGYVIKPNEEFTCPTHLSFSKDTSRDLCSTP